MAYLIYVALNYVEEKLDNIGMRPIFKRILFYQISFQIYYNEHMNIKNKWITKYK